MKANVIILLMVAGVVYAAQLGTLTRSTEVATTAEMEAYTVDPASLQEQIASNAVAIAALQVFH